MTFLAPWALWAAGAVSAAVIALHILASKNPRVTALPTTRFIPDVPLRATARALRLTDCLLLLLRVAVVMLAAVAFARPGADAGEKNGGARGDGRSVAQRAPKVGRGQRPAVLSRRATSRSCSTARRTSAGRPAPFGTCGESFSPEPRG